MWTHVRNLRDSEGVTVFLTTHYMDEADRVADRIAVIDHGRIVATGSSAELKRSEEHTSELQSPCNLVCRLLLEKKKCRPTKQLLLKPILKYIYQSARG